MSDTNAAAIVAAIEVLGAEIERLHAVADAQLAMIREHEDENAALRDELAHARQQADAATRKAAALIGERRSEAAEWEYTAQQMNAAGAGLIRFDPFDKKWEAGDSDGAIVHRAYTLSAAVAMLRGAAEKAVNA